MSPIDANASGPDHPIKRAPVVYGKRSNPLPPPSAVLDDQAQSSEYDRVYHAHTVPAQRRQPSSPSPFVHPSDSEHSHSPDAADPFKFGFRHRLKELDEQFDDCDAQSPRPCPPPSGQAVRAGPSQVKDFQSVSMGTAILSSEARCSSGSRASLPPSPASLHATSDQERTLESPLVRPRVRRVANIVPSDSEESNNSSPVSLVRHAITTPHSRSSPTPPTSGEILMVSRKTKGKAAARDVLPLIFDGERPSAAELPTKSKKGRRSEPLARPKTRAPTKKERREAAVESCRIAADRPVEVMRTQEQKHSLSAFFAGLRRDNILTPASGAELPSDPIEKFSSPTDKPTGVPPLNSVFGAPTGHLRTSVYVGTSSQSPSFKSAKALPHAAEDSDDELPSVTSLIRRESGKQQRLREMKQAALQHSGTSKTFDIDNEDDDDDLLIVKDDMHTVAREEAAQRRLDKAHGSPVKDIATLRRINHPSVRPPVVSPHKLSKQELQEHAKPSFARMWKDSKGQLTKKQLDQLMMMQHTEEQLKSIKRHEEEWIKGGGKLSRETGGDGTQTSLSQKLGAYAEQGLKSVQTGDAVGDEASADESDEDYTPDLRGSASPEPMDANEDDASGEAGDNMGISQPQADDDDEEVVAPLGRKKSGQRYRVVVGSDDEGEQVVHRNLPSVQRDVTSSIESQTEDENDKENSAKLMYDRSEDKENKAVVRHEMSSSEMAFGSILGSLQSVGDGVRESPSPASATDFNDTTTRSPKGDVRSPLKDISKDEDDLFLTSPPANSPFTKRLLRSAAMSPPHSSTSTLSLGSPVLRTERVSRINHLSLDSENDENVPSGPKPRQLSFLERLHSQLSPEPSLPSINPFPNGGFSQLFSAEDRSLTKPADWAENDGLSLTLDVGLKPALEVSGTLRQKAENIFEKEQEYVVAAAVQQNDAPKELLYVNDHGFLTQTRPEGSSPQAYCMTPSQASRFIGTQAYSTQLPLSARPPLRTLSLTISQELSPEQRPLRRLRKRSPSPLEQKFVGKSSNPVAKLNVFSILGKTIKPPSKAQKEKHEKSEFVAVEAEESDEDDMFGFGGPKKDDDEEDGEEEDKVVEGLVDDAVMDAETEAVDLVLEKHREHEDEDDQRLQKLHQDATEGRFRIKRRDRGVGFDDDSDEDDEDAHRIGQRIHKKRKIEGDSLEALGQNEETRAFYNTYHQDLIDEDDEFGHLREDVPMPADDDDVPADEPQQETVSVDEIRQRVREIAQNDPDVAVLNPEDTSWIDQSMMTEVDDAVRVKVVKDRQSKSTARHPNAGQMDFDVERPKRHAEDEQERKQMISWFKTQSHGRHGTGRSGNSAAVTGHTKVKSGGGSLRSTQPKNVATVSEAHKTKASSLLSTVSHRRGKFA